MTCTGALQNVTLGLQQSAWPHAEAFGTASAGSRRQASKEPVQRVTSCRPTLQTHTVLEAIQVTLPSERKDMPKKKMFLKTIKHWRPRTFLLPLVSGGVAGRCLLLAGGWQDAHTSDTKGASVLRWEKPDKHCLLLPGCLFGLLPISTPPCIGYSNSSVISKTHPSKCKAPFCT